MKKNSKNLGRLGNSSQTPSMLTAEEVKLIHQRLSEDFSTSNDPISPTGVKSEHLLESAVSRQHTGHGKELKYADPLSNAATLLFGVIANHPFHNGNKRTALVSMLVHLDRNKIGLFNTDQTSIFEMVLAVANHQIFMRDGRFYLNDGQTRDPDEEVQGITHWLSERHDKLVTGETIIRYRELFRILHRFGFEVEDPKNNTIEIARYVETKGGIFSRTPRTVRTHIATVAYPGESKQVALGDIKRIRKICKLEEIDGVDHHCFYDNAVMVDSFINHYRTILRRLARR